MNMEIFLLVMAIVLAAVFNVIVPWLKRQQEDGLAGNTETELEEVQTADMAPSASALPAPQFEAQRNSPTGKVRAIAPVAAQPARRLALRSRAGMRDGIVLAAVLGPCRAQAPFV